MLLSVSVGLGRASRRRWYFRRAFIAGGRGHSAEGMPYQRHRSMLAGHTEGTAGGRDNSSSRCVGGLVGEETADVRRASHASQGRALCLGPPISSR